MSKLCKDGLSCPVCGSRDAGVIYKNRNKEGDDFLVFKCFSGNHPLEKTVYKINSIETYDDDVLGKSSEKGTKIMDEQLSSKPKTTGGLLSSGAITEINTPDHPWGARRIREEVANFYGVSIRPDTPVTQNFDKLQALLDEGKPVRDIALIFPFYNLKGELVAQKVRTPVNLKGSWYKRDENAKTDSGFFGQQLFNSPSIHEIAITFGEFDAMAVYQMMGIPAVSITDGDQSAYKQFQKEYAWLSRFKTIYLVPDNDDSCRHTINSLGSLFPSKTRIVMATKHKDASDYLKNKDEADFRQEFRSAPYFSPQGILSIRDLKSLLFQKPPEPIANYPWDGLNELTGGIWAGELITIKAPPKVGKTSVMTTIAHHLKNTTAHKMGLIYLEETHRDLIFRFVSFELKQNLQRKEVREGVSREEIEVAADSVLAGDQIFLLDHWGSCSSDFLEEKMTEFVRAKGCQFIFFDHISMAITDESNKDERIALDRLVATIKALTTGIPDQETVWEVDEKGEGKWETKTVLREPTIFMVTHVNDDGKTRGSRAAVQQSNLVLSLSRDKLAKTEQERNILDITVEENRRLGESGLACRLFYDKYTSMLTEIPSTSGEESPNAPPVFERGSFHYNTKQH